MMVGPGGVGKSSFLRGLMNQRLVQRAESTILADTKTVKPQFWAKAGESADSYWAEVTDQDEIKELAGLFQLVLANLHPSKAAAVGESNPQEDKPQSAQTISDESVSDIKDTEVQKVLQQVAEHDLHHSQNPAAPQSEVLMHVWDCGGQAVFLDFLPAFLTSRTMFLLFFDARQNLDEKCKTLSHKAGRVVSKSKESFTTLQLLSQWMASIHAMCIRKDTFTAPSASENPATQGNEAHASFDGQESLTTSVGEDINPKIIPVGTHGDAVRNGRKRDKILSTLQSHCEGKAYTPLLLDGVIVDNTTAGLDREGEDKGFNYIRKRVHQFASKDLAVRTPVTWVLFRKVLQNVAKDNPIVPYERAVAVGQACRIAEDVVRSVLHFYHELAVFLHYTQIENFSDKVIVDPQWLVKQLGKLLAPEELKQKVSNRSLLEPLHENGILVQRLYEEVWEESNSKYKIPQNSLVDLLNHFLLAAPLDHIDPDKLPKSVIPYEGQKYFIPSVLKLSSTHLAITLHKYCIPCVSDSATQPVKMSSPLHLTFSTQYVPPGFFTRLATTLTGKPNCQPLFPRGVYRNKITFAYDQVDEFTICEQSSSVQISVVRIRHHQSREMTFGNTCCTLKELIQACSAIVKEWLPSVKVKASFLCEQCPDFITIPPGANTNSNLRCKAGHSCNLTKEKQYWLKIPCTPECFAQKGDLNDAELQGVAYDVQKYGKLKELADELEMPLYGVNAPITLLRRWHSEIENGLEAHSLLVHHLKCIGLTGTSESLYCRQFLSPSRTNPIADTNGAAGDSGRAREIFDSVDNIPTTITGKLECSQQQNLRWENVDDTPLDERSLRAISDSISTLAAEWFNLGVALGLFPDTLREIDSNHRGEARRCLTEMVIAWLRKKDNSQPSWWSLVSALSSPSVGRVEIATMIAAKYSQISEL